MYVNIYIYIGIHTIGAMLFIWFYMMEVKEDHDQTVPKWPIHLFLLCAIFCLCSSAFFHLCFVINMKWYQILVRLDYAGIVLMITGSAIPVLSYALHCHPTLFKLYSFFLIAASVALLSLLLFHPKFPSTAYMHLRVGLFLLLASTAVFPILHAALVLQEEMLLNSPWLCLMAMLYLLGALIYSTRFPECVYPGRFDLWCSSHQLWHLFVLTAACIHYRHTSIHFYIYLQWL